MEVENGSLDLGLDVPLFIIYIYTHVDVTSLESLVGGAGCFPSGLLATRGSLQGSS